MQRVLRSVISPLLIYRLAFGVGAIFIYADGYLADSRIILPQWVIGFRELSIVACLSILFLSYLSVVVFASFFLILTVSNLHARSRQASSEQAANAWFDNSADALIYGDVSSETVKRANPKAVELFETSDTRAIIEIIVGAILDRDPTRRRSELLADAASADSMEDVFEFTTALNAELTPASLLTRIPGTKPYNPQPRI